MHVALPKSRSGSGGTSASGEQRLGFLAAGKDAALGYVGGYLLTTARGRPLEFHYTSGVKPSPTHRILYGAELEPYIFEELIAANLIRQSAIEPAFVITDQPLVLRLRPKASCPIVYVAATSVRPEVVVASEPNVDASDPPSAVSVQPAEVPSARLETHPNFAGDIEALAQWLKVNNPSLDVAEPFGRIWEALCEVSTAESKQAA